MYISICTVIALLQQADRLSIIIFTQTFFRMYSNRLAPSSRIYMNSPLKCAWDFSPFLHLFSYTYFILSHWITLSNIYPCCLPTHLHISFFQKKKMFVHEHWTQYIPLKRKKYIFFIIFYGRIKYNTLIFELFIQNKKKHKQANFIIILLREFIVTILWKLTNNK